MPSLEEFSNEPGYYRLHEGELFTADTQWHNGNAVRTIGRDAPDHIGRQLTRYTAPCRRPGQRQPPPITSNRPPANVRMAKVTPINLP